MDIVDRIIKIAKDKAITGVEIGELLGLKKSPLTDWKNGKSKPTLEQTIAICEKFAISADYLLFGFTKENGEATLSSDECDVLNNYRKLDTRGKHKVHTTIYEELDRVAAASAQEQRELNEIFTLASSTNIPAKSSTTTLDSNKVFSPAAKKG